MRNDHDEQTSRAATPGAVHAATSVALDPATGEVIGSFPLDTVDGVRNRIRRARTVQKDWADIPYGERSARMARVGTYLNEHKDELAFVISRNNGKTLVDAIATEVLPAAMAVGYYRKEGRRLLKPRKVSGGSIMTFNKSSRLVRRPVGVVGIISPWNYPFAIPFSEVVMALLAGNAVVLKVASDSLAVGDALERCFAAAGFPEGLFSYVNLPGRDAGKAFIAGGVDKLFFTGSTAVGRELMGEAATRLLPLVLELGGNDAAIVRADADLERSADGIVWAGFSNAGQSCAGAQRIFVHCSVYGEFLDLLRERVERLRVGPGSDFNSGMGCMTSPRQKAAVQAQIDACLAGGARVFAKSPVDSELEAGNFMAAMILVDVTPEMPVMREEVFGPVVAVMPYETDDDAVRMANDSPYGLTGSVWSRDRRAACTLAARIRAGTVTVNDHLMSHGLAETPWGGCGDSGLGRTHGELGFLEMLDSQVIVDDWLPGVKKDIWWHPYSRKVYHGVCSILDFLYGRTVWVRLKALPALLGIFMRYWEK